MNRSDPPAKKPVRRSRAAPAPGDGVDVEPADGRRQRSANSRRRIVEAMIVLVRDGNPMPSAEAVSRQADVSLRTVFRHFEDMDSLYQEMSVVVEAEVMPWVTEPLPESAWPERLGSLVTRRARVFERIMPFKVAANLRRHQSAVLVRHHDAFRDHQRRNLQQAVPAALRGNAALFEALDLLLSFESWHRLRVDQGLGVARAQGVLLAAASAITTAAGC
jgi:AcrR family transcriptional regulator